MALGTVLQTALSGISAAQFNVGLAANNLANLNTYGFKASRAAFSTQASATRGLGSAPTDVCSRSEQRLCGGTNPLQVGLGVRPGASLADFSQGTIAVNARPTSLALQGDGFFILQGTGGENLYTRNGDFSLNGSGELVNSDGLRVLGSPVNEDFEIQPTRLSPLSFRPGMQAKGDDGSGATLTQVSVAEDGRIQGSFTDGVRRDLGQVQVARFANPSGLQHRGGTTYAAGPNSGLPVQGFPGQRGAASVTGGAVELSNTDIGRSLIALAMSSTQFRANLAVISVTEEIYDDLLNLRRAV